MRVERLPPDVVNQFAPGASEIPMVVYGAIDGNVILACGGLAWMHGRCWVWVNVFADISGHTRLLLRWASRMMRQARQLGEKEVFVWRDEWHPSSSKLLEIVGFDLCGCDAETGKEIFVCPV